MKYKPKIDEDGQPYYIPIVVKNKDYLIGYIKGIEDSKDIMNDLLSYMNINADVDNMDVMLDSTRFNDILENGKRESEMSDEELRDYFYDLIDEISRKNTDDNIENNIDDDYIFHVECSCNLGYYAWKDYDSIPDENFKCVNCGKVLIHYTGNYCHNYEYDYNGGKYD